jgi:CheY-like chemotaxis protein
MKKILVIEDEKDIQDVISTLLTEEGYSVCIAKNGKEGLSLARKEIPDLIICDIVMPVLDGYSVLTELSENPDMKSIPFIFLTARVEKEDIRLGRELGAGEYLHKPFRADDLLKAIESLLNKNAGDL